MKKQKIKSLTSLSIYHNSTLVGTLSLTPDGRQAVFEYDNEWQSSGFSLNPLTMPLTNELFIAPQRPFDGNFGIFEDSLPDGYGRYLLDRLLRREGFKDGLQSLNALQKLSLIGTSGFSSLNYLPSTLLAKKVILPNFDRLEALAIDVLAERAEDDQGLLYYSSGNSGGCRPKCIYSDEEGHWLVKFRNHADNPQAGQEEFNYNLLARECGICVSDFKLVDNRFFASKRFDIDGEERIYTPTAGGLLNSSIDALGVDYKTLLNLTGFLTQSPDQVVEMYRRMVFNVLADNKDDHVKNFSFQMVKGNWRLAPAYDLTPSHAGYGGEHATTVMGNGTPGADDLCSAGRSIRINGRLCKIIIEEIADVLRKNGIEPVM